jgi:chaperonin GroEL
MCWDLTIGLTDVKLYPNTNHMEDIMSKIVKYNDAARQAIKKGVDKLTNAVKVTLGPKGRNVLLRREYGLSHVTKDGVTIAKEINLRDQFEDMGAQMVKHAAQTTCDAAGDGTTTAALLSQAIYSSGLRLMAAGHNPMDLKRGIDKAVAKVIETLVDFTQETRDPKLIAQVGTISANGDATIGNLIAEAMEKVGRDGVITIEEAKGFDTTLDITEGMRFDRGYLSSYFVTVPERAEAVLENCLVLVTANRLDNIHDIEDILNSIVQSGNSLMIIADDVSGTALPALVINKMRGVLKVCAVKAPGFGDRRLDMLKDIAVLTGSTLFSEETGTKVNTASVGMLGRAEKIVINRNNTTIIGGHGTKEEITERIEQVKLDIEQSVNDWDKGKTRERLAKLLGGVAVVRVGAPTEAEMKEKKDRVEDAMNATKAAVEEGIVPGGGVALLRCIPALQEFAALLSESEKAGAIIILEALEAPLRQIAYNAGSSSDMIVSTVSLHNEKNYGWDAANDKYVDMMEVGIIDPKKVVRCALQNAASVASMLLTTEAIVADDPDDEKPKTGSQM